MDDGAKRYVREQGSACPLVNLPLKGWRIAIRKRPKFNSTTSCDLKLHHRHSRKVPNAKTGPGVNWPYLARRSEPSGVASVDILGT